MQLKIYSDKASEELVQKWLIEKEEFQNHKSVSSEELKSGRETDVKVVDGNIKTTLAWLNGLPPIVLPDLKLNQPNLYAVLYYLQGEEVPHEYMKDPKMVQHYELLGHIQNGTYPFDVKCISLHNLAVLLHYSQEPGADASVEGAYLKALKSSKNEEITAFTALFYAKFLWEIEEAESSISIFEKNIESSILPQGKAAYKIALCSLYLHSYAFIDHPEIRDAMKGYYDDIFNYFGKEQQWKQLGFVYMDRAYMSQYLGDYSDSLSNIQTALMSFEKAGDKPLQAEAMLHKGLLLYTSSKNGQIQHYKSSINAFQNALQFFKKDTFPIQYAEIQEQLGLIYSEIPVEENEQAIWSAFSASAFKNAMTVFTKSEYPYEYAGLVHNYATALMRYPEAKIHDNLKLAEGYFLEALSIKSGRDFPNERVLSLLNYVELLWLIDYEADEVDTDEWVRKIQNLLEEIKSLTDDQHLLERVNYHENQLLLLNKN